MDRPTDEGANELITPPRPDTHTPVATDGSIEPSVRLTVPASVAGAASTRAPAPPARRRQVRDDVRQARTCNTRSCVQQTQPPQSDHHQTTAPCSRLSIPRLVAATITRKAVAAADHGGTGRRRAMPSICSGHLCCAARADGFLWWPSRCLRRRSTASRSARSRVGESVQTIRMSGTAIGSTRTGLWRPWRARRTPDFPPAVRSTLKACRSRNLQLARAAAGRRRASSTSC